jgi:tyrosinase
VALHLNATNGGIHNVGVFLPWHRLTVWTYESVLRNECGYTGAQPYWDYTLDTPEKGGRFNSSPIFDPVYGFGGGGKGPVGAAPIAALPSASTQASAPAQSSAPAQASATPKGGAAPKTGAPKGPAKGPGGMSGMCGFGSVCGACVTDGPFAQYKIYIGPGNSTKSNPRCLTRNINAQAAESGASQKGIEKLMAKSTYEQFQTLDTSPGERPFSGGGFTPGIHSVGHMGVGGEVSSVYGSFPFSVTDSNR